ncbi:MAG: hypothetical protein ACTFAK_10610 [Candidatus Electronema sp. VV]
MEGVAQEFAIGLYAADSPQAQTDGNVVIDSPSSDTTFDDALRFQLPSNIDSNRYLIDYVIPDLVIPDLCVAAPMLSDCRNFRHLRTEQTEEQEPISVQGVNLIEVLNND